MKEFRIYVVLGFEDMTKKDYNLSADPRINKILKVASDLKAKDLKDTKIILSGKSGFVFKPKQTQAKVMQNYILKKNKSLKKSIILEEESMDTLGNIYFSSLIILKLLNKIGHKYDKVHITLITEDYHMHRAFHFLRQVLTKWQPKCEFDYIKAKDEKYSIFTRLFKHVFDTGVELVIEKDFDTFGIYSFQDYEDYLFSLPVYREHYKAQRLIFDKVNRKSDISHYAKAIEKKLKADEVKD